MTLKKCPMCEGKGYVKVIKVEEENLKWRYGGSTNEYWPLMKKKMN